MKYYSLAFLAIVVAVLGFIIVPQYTDHLFYNEITQNFRDYRKSISLMEDVFNTDTMKNSPESIQKIDFAKLRKLGSHIGVSYSNLASFLKRKYGYIWLDSALASTHLVIYTKLIKKHLSFNIRIFVLINILMIIAIAILFIIYAIASNKIERETSSSSFSYILFAIGIIGSLAGIVLMLPVIKNYLQNPFNTDILFFNYDAMFYLAFFALALQIFFLIFLSIKSITTFKNNSRFAFVWLIPILLILVNVIEQPKSINSLYDTLTELNWQYEVMDFKTMQSNYIASLRYKIKTENITDLSQLVIEQKFIDGIDAQYAKIKVSTEGTKLIITATSYKKDHGKHLQFKVLYDILSDTISTNEKLI